MISLKEKGILLTKAYEDEIEQEANGKYQLSFKYPTSDDRWKAISPGALILADDLHGEQEFRVFEVTKRHGYLYVYAEQVANDLNRYSISSISVDRVTGGVVMSNLAGSIIRSHPFSFYSDIDTRHTFNEKNVSAMSALAEGKHSILGQWGGDLVRDKYHISLLKNGGRDSEALFMYQKNLTAYIETDSIKDLVTRLHLSIKDSDVMTTVDSPLIEAYNGRIYELSIEVSDQDVQTVEQLQEYGRNYFAKNLVDIPNNSLEIAVTDNQEYDVRIFDTVFVHHKVFGKDLRMKITSYKFSPMGRKLKSIGFGKTKANLAQQVSSIAGDVSEKAVSVSESAFEKKLQKEIENADRVVGKKIEDLKSEIHDGIEQAQADAEVYADNIKQTILGQMAESDRQYQLAQQAQDQQIAESLRVAGASTNLANIAKTLAEQAKAELTTAKQSLGGQITQLTGQAGQLERSLGLIRTDVTSQAQSILAQAQRQTELTSRVTTVETIANGTKSTVTELSKTLTKATGDIASVSSRTKTVEDTLTQTRTQYEALTQTVNEHTGQIDSVSRRTATIEAGLTGLQERFENIRVGATNYIRDFGFANGHSFNNNQSVWRYERIEDGTARSGYHIKATCTQAGWGGFHKALYDLRGARYQGRVMTYSVDIKTSKSVRMRLGAEAFSRSLQIFDVTTDWQRFISTDTVGYRTFYSFPFYTDGVQWQVGDVIYIRDPQLEDGNIATTPHAAEEDLRSDLATYKRTAEESSVDLSRQIQLADGKAVEAKTFAQQAATQLSTRLTSLETYKDGESIRASQYFSASRDETARQVTALRTAVTDGYVAKAKYEEDARGVTQRFESLQVGGSNIYVLSANSQITTTQLTNFNQNISTGEISFRTSGVDAFVGHAVAHPNPYRPVYGIKIPVIPGRSILVQITNDRFTKNYVSYFDSNSNTLKNFTEHSTNRFSLSPSQLSGASFITLRYGIGYSNLAIGTDLKTKIKVEYGTLHTDWSPAPEDQKTYTETKIAEYRTTVDGRFATMQSETIPQAILSSKQIKDTRNDNQSPQWYWSNYPKQTVEEFKIASVIGLANESMYAYLTTNVQWGTSTGGKVKQTAKTDRATYERYGTGTTWDPWVKVANMSDLANYTTRVDFQRVQETSQLYERIIGSSDAGIASNVARMAMTSSLFQTEVARLESNAEILARTSDGLGLTTDPTFELGLNGVLIYNNANNGNVTLIRQSNVGSSQPNGKANRLMITHTGDASPSLGGIRALLHQYSLNKEYVIDFVAMLPVGYRLELGHNGLGAGGDKKWITSNVGTGKWERYIGYYKLGTGFGSIPLAYVYVIGATPTTANPLIWYIQSLDILDLSNSSSKALTNRVSQLGGSWAVQNLTSAGTILNQFNLLANGTNRIDGRLTHITGQTLIDNGVINTAMIGSLDAGKITSGYLSAARIASEAITADKIKVDQALFTKLMADEALFKQLFAKNAFITQVQAVTLSASKISGGVLSSKNGETIFNLDEGILDLYKNGTIRFHTGSNAIYRQDGIGVHTAFLNFDTVDGHLYAGFGVTSSSEGLNSRSTGRFTGVRCFRTSKYPNKYERHDNDVIYRGSHETSKDEIDVVGDYVRLIDDFHKDRGVLARPVVLPEGRWIDLLKLAESVEHLWNCWGHAKNGGMNPPQAIMDERNRYQQYFYTDKNGN